MSETTKWFCATRALKNARYLQKHAPQVMPAVEPAAGFGSVIPLEVLGQLQTSAGRTAAAKDARLSKLLEGVKLPAADVKLAGPLFNGIVYLVHLKVTVQDQGNRVFALSDADIATALEYLNLAVVPITQYASQYGPCDVQMSQFVITAEETLPTAVYNDSTVQGWVNALASQLDLPPSSCLAFLNPPGIVNTMADLSKGTAGYHYMANIPYAFADVRVAGLTLDDRAWSYAGHISHEIAEMTVDPRGDDSNPEVCDPCGPNCVSTFLDFFDASGNYLATSQDFPPSFNYTFFINGIVRPSAATECPPPNPGAVCSYGPADPFAITTDVAPASAGRANNLFVFVKTLDGHVHFNQVSPGSVFVGWQEVPGGLVTGTALAAGMRDTTLFVFARTPGNQIVFNQAAAGGAFVGWQAMPGGLSTDVALASAGRASNLFVFAKTLDGHIHFNQSAPGGAFVGWQEVPGGMVTNAPLAAGMRDTTLFVFAKTLDNQIVFNQAAAGGAFVGWEAMPGGITTDVGLASAGRQSDLFVFAKQLDGSIVFNQSAPGGAFVGWQAMPGGLTTTVPLGAGMQGTTLFVFARRNDGRVVYSSAPQGGAFSNWRY